jgi:transcriptional regulator with XRE-family HTH domain
MATLSEQLTATPEGKRLYNQEKTILELTELICEVLEQTGVTRSQLAERLGKSKAHISQLLDGEANMTIRTISDIFTALGRELRFIAVPTSSSVSQDGAEHRPASPETRRWRRRA